MYLAAAARLFVTIYHRPAGQARGRAEQDGGRRSARQPPPSAPFDSPGKYVDKRR